MVQLEKAAAGSESPESLHLRKNVDDLRDKNDKLKKELEELEPLVSSLQCYF